MRLPPYQEGFDKGEVFDGLGKLVAPTKAL